MTFWKTVGAVMVAGLLTSLALGAVGIAAGVGARLLVAPRPRP